jgi:hypothetical protein
MDREYRFCGFEGHVEGVLEAFRTVSEDEFCELLLFTILGSFATPASSEARGSLLLYPFSRGTNEGPCLNEKVVGDAQYAECRARGVCGRRGRQHLSFLQLLRAQDNDQPGTFLTASSNRAHDDDA